MTAPNTEQSVIEENALNLSLVKTALQDNKLKRIIVIPNRIVNIVI